MSDAQKKAWSVILTLAMVMGAVVVLGPASEKAAAMETEIVSDATGYIRSGALTYSDAVAGLGFFGVDTNANSAPIGYTRTFPAGWEVYKTYLSFNTTLVAGNIIGARLRVFVDWTYAGWRGHELRLHSLNFSDLGGLESGDWIMPNTDLGALGNTSSIIPAGSWMEMSIDPIFINNVDGGIAGTATQFFISYTDDDRFAHTYVETDTAHARGSFADATLRPRLLITTTPYYGVDAYFNFSVGAGRMDNATLFPVEKWQHNNSVELWRFEFMSYSSTAPADYVNITLNDNMTVASISAFCTYTVINNFLNITDMDDWMFYWIWIYVEIPQLVDVYISMYDPILDKGHYWESWPVYYNTGGWANITNASRIGTPYIQLPYDPDQNYTFFAIDRYSNIVGQTVVVIDTEPEYIDINVPVYELTLTSQADYDIQLRLMDSTNLTAGRTFDLVAQSWRWDSLRPANYTLRATWINGPSAGAISWYNITISGPALFKVNGTTLTIIQTILGNLTVTSNHMLQSVTPGMIVYDDNPARVPGKLKGAAPSMTTILDPWLTIWADVDTYDDGAGSATAPSFNASGMPGSVTILKDKLRATTPASNYWLNDTEANWVHDNQGPGAIGSTYDLLGNLSAGHEMLLESDVAVPTCSAERSIGFRYAERFNWSLQGDTLRYSCTVTVQNNFDAAVTLQNPQVSIAFFNGSAPTEGSSLVVKDLDSNLILEQGVNYIVTESDVRFEFASLTFGEMHNYSLTYYGQYNQSTNDLLAVASSYEVFTYEGKSMYLSTGRASNTQATTLAGDMNIKLDFKKAGDISVGTMIIYDLDLNMEVPADRWVYVGNTVIIYHSQLGDVEPGESRGFSVMYLFEADSDLSWFNEPWLYVGGFPVNLLLALCIAAFIAAALGGMMAPKNGKIIAAGLTMVGIALMTAYIFIALVYYPASASYIAALGPPLG